MPGYADGGFEEEILYLLRRMRARIDQKGQDGVSRKTNLKSSKSSRELKKLEYTVSYKKTKMGTSVVWVFLEGFLDRGVNENKNFIVEC